MTPADEKTKALIAWIATHSWRESRFSEPNPQSHVPTHPLLDEIVRLNDLDPEEVDRMMVDAQEVQEKKK